MSERQIALVSARAARNLDDDQPLLERALREAGAQVRIVDWDDAAVDWASFDLAVLRSTWDYTTRLDEFRTWIARAGSQTRLINSPEVVRWNTDKHYLADLEKAGAPIIPAVFVEPGGSAADGVARVLASTSTDEIVVKPAVGAGSKDAERHARANIAAMRSHVQRLIDAGRSAVLQPFLSSVDEYGETALLFFGGEFSHAIRKGPMLKPGATSEPAQNLFVSEHISPRVPTDAELNVGRRVLAAVPFGMPIYARVDLLRNDDGSPALLELELTEPSLFLVHAPGSAERFARLLLHVREAAHGR